ncbi:hypothetical protein NPIL_476421 [Nephila pilipes]|uniref:Uncharacterized protein n=1 Tax=Nephila pilipes TaxID=299642 RepID=A0A8X6U5N5_NEPPI|nr:hypothetical protein NPIL_476421 [Nephila pilipes]
MSTLNEGDLYDILMCISYPSGVRGLFTWHYTNFYGDLLNYESRTLTNIIRLRNLRLKRRDEWYDVLAPVLSSVER